MSTPPDSPTAVPPLTHLDPSELGTKQYWDALYTTELTNHAANPRDEGTVWFDDSDAEAKIVDFLANTCPSHPDYEPPSPSSDTPALDLGLHPATARILDLGTGNGSLLLALHSAGWTGQLLGVDYSPESIRLAREVQAARSGDGAGAGGAGVEFQQWDILLGDLSSLNEGTWDLVLDKGTFDAVSLSEAAARGACEGYGGRVERLLRVGGKFLVTSCNWTEGELRGWFEGGGMRLVGRIGYPSFSFGGLKGQTISTLCFERVDG